MKNKQLAMNHLRVKTNKLSFFATLCAWILVLICMSCGGPSTINNTEPPEIEQPPVLLEGYDTISLENGYWLTAISHRSFEEGFLFAQITFHTEALGWWEDLKWGPYEAYDIYVISYQQDTLLPIGEYTIESDKPKYILKEYSFAAPVWESWDTYKFVYFRDARMYIKQDSVSKKHYIEAFIHLKTGEKHYIRTDSIKRMFLSQNGDPILGWYRNQYYPE